MKTDKKTLYDIYPNLDETEDSGLVIADGNCSSVADYKQHQRFLGSSGDNLYFPENVTSITGDVDFDDEIEVGFDFIGTIFDNCVITTNCTDIDAPIFQCGGFKHFYVVDAETKEVVFYSDEFDFDHEFIVNDEFQEFCDGLCEGNYPW